MTNIFHRSRAALSVLEGTTFRTRVFVPVFAVACLASLAYVFLRPPVYVSNARVQVEAPRSQQRTSADGEVTPNLLIAVQRLTSSAVLDAVLQHVGRSQSGAGAVSSTETLREMLSANPVTGTNVIELQAEGAQRGLLPLVLDAWIESYRRSQTETHDRSSTAALDEARRVVEHLTQVVTTKRKVLAEYRAKADIVSLEREENQSVARLRGLNSSLNEARNKEVNAEARVSAMRERLAAGKSVVEKEERSNIANLERRAIDLRDKMRDLEQEYTKSYLAHDPKYKALLTNLTRLEEQIARERATSAEQALQGAEEDLSSARQTVLQLQKEMGGRKREIQEFTNRFAEHAALVNELKGLEESFDAAKQHLSKLEGERQAVGPQLTVLSLPSVPELPARPHYWRDALIAVTGSGFLGLIAVWFIEFIRRSPEPFPELARQPVIHIAYAPNAMLEAPIPVLNAPVRHLPEPFAQFPRELTGPEVHALWAAASPDARLVIAALFSGISIDELADLRYESIDFENDRAYLGGSSRSAALREPMKRLLKERQATHSAGLVVADPRGGRMSSADLEGLIACAAYDAGLADASEVTSEVLRHTYLAYLIRQGARLADIGGIVGQIAPATFREYGRLSPSGPGLPLEQIDPVFPALRASAA